MFKKIMATCLCICFLMVTSFVYAADVYFTKNGKKYHQEVCRFTKNREVTKIDKEEAVENGLLPCQRCYKEDISTADSSDLEDQS